MKTPGFFFDGRIDLQSAETTWASFKTVFRERYRDIHTDQYQFTQLQTAKQRNDESIQEFADRCRTLVQRLITPEEVSVKRSFHQEQAERMLLASFIYGLAGQPGKQTRYVAPSTVQEALKIALLLEQEEKLEKLPGVFLIGHQGCHNGAEPQGRALVDQGVQTEAAKICYRWGK
jgi:hypothetical protein